MPAKKRRRRSSLELGVAAAMKSARKEKLAFQKRLSEMLSEALGMEVEVRIKAPAVSPDTKRAKRTPKRVSGVYYDELEEIFDGPNSILSQKPDVSDCLPN